MRCMIEASCVQGAVSIAGVRWLHGMEQHLAELGDTADADAAGQGTKWKQQALAAGWQNQGKPPQCHMLLLNCCHGLL